MWGAANFIGKERKLGQARRLTAVLKLVLLLLVILICAWTYLSVKQPVVLLVARYELASWWQRSGPHYPGDCTGQWSVSIDADRPMVFPFFPETRSVYRVMILDAQENGNPLSLRVRGNMADARYESFHLYDAQSAAILDAVEMRELPGAGTRAPFDIFFRQSTDTRSTLAERRFTPSSDRVVLVWRVYLPAGSAVSAADLALPDVSALDEKTGAAVADCRNRFTLPSTVTSSVEQKKRRAALEAMRQDQQRAIAAGEADPIRFHIRRPNDTPLLANRHVTYAFAPLFTDLGSSALLRFRKPQGLRYWSVCSGGIEETNTAACLNDTQMQADEQGMVTVFSAPDTQANAARAQALGAAFLPTADFQGDAVLILRELRTSSEKLLPTHFEAIDDADLYRGNAVVSARYCDHDTC
ncbi:MAG: hypothetical protein WBO55_02970 [Rhizobiaceae bacterium]